MTLARRIWRKAPACVRRSHGLAVLVAALFPVEPVFQTALNGQSSKRRIVGDVFSSWPFRAVVETGTGFGATTAHLATLTGLPTFTVEVEPRRFVHSRRRLRHLPQVRCYLSDSVRFLRQCARDRRLPERDVFFYLDAHGGDGPLPLSAEVELAASQWDDAVVMIDDFEVPDDPGYGVDEWDGCRLSLARLPPLDRLHLEAFFPSASSAEDTGFRRGCVVLAHPRPAAKLRELSSLRPVPRLARTTSG